MAKGTFYSKQLITLTFPGYEDEIEVVVAPSIIENESLCRQNAINAAIGKVMRENQRFGQYMRANKNLFSFKFFGQIEDTRLGLKLKGSLTAQPKHKTKQKISPEQTALDLTA